MATIGQHLTANPAFCRETANLLAFVCRRNLSWLLAHPEYRLSPAQEKKFQQKYKHWQTGEPLAYVIGYQDFYDYRFRVSPAVLIPRPESELIVDAGLAYARLTAGKKLTFLDVGTGSGALIISFAKSLKEKIPAAYRQAEFMASDISTTALRIARANAHAYRLDRKIIFRLGDLLTPWRKIFNQQLNPLFIAANLPYLTPKERRSEPSLAQEPDLALLGGRDGLSLYRRFLPMMNNLLQNRPFCLLMEINPEQAPALIKLAGKYFTDDEIKKMPDLSGRTRFIKIQRD